MALQEHQQTLTVTTEILSQNNRFDPQIHSHKQYEQSSFIHIEHLYSASSRELHRGGPDSSTAKKSSYPWSFSLNLFVSSCLIGRQTLRTCPPVNVIPGVVQYKGPSIKYVTLEGRRSEVRQFVTRGGVKIRPK